MSPGDNIIVAHFDSKTSLMFSWTWNWNLSNHRHKVYNHRGFQIIISIQFVDFFLEINVFIINVFYALQVQLHQIRDSLLSDHTVKSRVKENLLSVEYPSSFVPFLTFQGWICSITFSIKAFRLFANCGTLVRFIVSASLFYGKRSSRNFMHFLLPFPKKDNIYCWLIYCWVQLGSK